MPLPSSATQICSEAGWRCGGLIAPGCTVTLVSVTRREGEFSGNSNCSDCTPELESVVIAFFRTISIGPPNRRSKAAPLHHDHQRRCHSNANEDNCAPKHKPDQAPGTRYSHLAASLAALGRAPRRPEPNRSTSPPGSPSGQSPRSRSRCLRTRSVPFVAAVFPQWREDGARNRSTDVKGAVRPLHRRRIKLPRQH